MPTDINHTNHNILVRENQVKEMTLYVEQAAGRLPMNFIETYPQVCCIRAVSPSKKPHFL